MAFEALLTLRMLSVGDEDSFSIVPNPLGVNHRILFMTYFRTWRNTHTNSGRKMLFVSTEQERET